MFKMGERIKFLDNEAIILSCSEDEVLLFIDTDYIKWVDKNLIELIPST